jgi:hypothetical protein
LRRNFEPAACSEQAGRSPSFPTGYATGSFVLALAPPGGCELALSVSAGSANTV